MRKTKMTWSKLASQIAYIEGKRSEAQIGDIREILKILRRLIHEEPLVIIKLLLS